MKTSKISCCTVYRSNELPLRKTLTANIHNSKDYRDIEFVVVDCNAQDDMENWIKKNMGNFIDEGRLVYYRMVDGDGCCHTQAKNIAMKLAHGDIICYIGACDYIGPGFAGYVNDMFARNSNICLCTAPFMFHAATNDHPPGYIIGKLCITKSHFMQAGGFDERMIKYGNEDLDMVNRLQLGGIKKEVITNPLFCGSVTQTMGKGFSLYQSLNNISMVYIRHCAPSESEVLYLYKDQYYEKGILYDNVAGNADQYKYACKPKDYTYRYSLKEIRRRGKWIDHINENVIRFYQEDELIFELKSRHNNRYDIMDNEADQSIFYAVEDPWLLEKTLLLNSVFYNSEIMEENLHAGNVKVNRNGFGKAAHVKNIRFEHTIQL